MVRIEIGNLTETRIPPIRILKKIIKKVLRLEKVSSGELNLIFVTDVEIKKLNRKYKKENHPTDVLAFNMHEARSLKRKKCIFGDIAISVDTAARQAKIFNTTRKKELYLYMIHGALHLLGYDDQCTKKRRRMEKRQSELMERVWNHLA